MLSAYLAVSEVGCFELALLRAGFRFASGLLLLSNVAQGIAKISREVCESGRVTVVSVEHRRVKNERTE